MAICGQSFIFLLKDVIKKTPENTLQAMSHLYKSKQAC